MLELAKIPAHLLTSGIGLVPSANHWCRIGDRVHVAQCRDKLSCPCRASPFQHRHEALLQDACVARAVPDVRTLSE